MLNVTKLTPHSLLKKSVVVVCYFTWKHNFYKTVMLLHNMDIKCVNISKLLVPHQVVATKPLNVLKRTTLCFPFNSTLLRDFKRRAFFY